MTISYIEIIRVATYRDGKGVEVEAHLTDVGLALAGGGGAAAGAHRAGIEVGAVLGERVPASRSD